MKPSPEQRKAIRERLLVAAGDESVETATRIGAFFCAFVLGLADARHTCTGCGVEVTPKTTCDTCGAEN